MAPTTWHPVTEAGGEFADLAAAEPDKVLLALDFDGTLAHLVPDPEDSRMHAGSAAALAQLGDRLGQVAIITGRAVDAVRRLGELEGRPGLGRLVVLGQYGVERWDAATGELREPEVGGAVAAAKRELVELLAELAAAGHPVAGVHLEDKQGRAIGVHTRRAEDPEAALALLDEGVRGIGERHGLHAEPGRLVIELRSSTRSKGDALADLVAEFSPGLVAMVGDDLGDLPAFELLPRLRERGIACCAVVSSSQEQPALTEVADVVCDGPDGVADWLTELARRVS
ncbi:trehalose-phosphatase [Tessaracoccus rhinocerotis]|uniref:Trehalose 6-phosphate phosphatase n=1 Tax=Tessaracoccus rhinocerotis TaxID=1689449 RepID=A0A553K456_9ACTN|nr:trehalose-phosphatase [Tessaracoccus rhinocerotis]TRY19487.1 trehalose-phosphatase [Tessaracoccus rhinocerotis]